MTFPPHIRALAGAALAALLCAAPAPLLAHDRTLGDLKIGRPYARVTIPGRPATPFDILGARVR